MTKPDPKPRRRIRASSTEWRHVRERRLTGWCEVCETSRAMSCHHIVRRSQGGDDVFENTLAVCGDGTTGCHGLLEGRSEWALERARRAVVLDPVRLDYVIGRKGWGWFNRAYPIVGVPS